MRLDSEASQAALCAETVGACPIVGIGASAGGLAAITELLGALPVESNVAVVVAQHLAPLHESRLPDLLAKSSLMPVLEAADGIAVEPNHVYVLPPNRDLEISGGALRLSPRDGALPHLPIDRFFRSLAQDQKSNAIGIVLSGTASDGALGMRAIKAAGGITFAQEPRTALHDGMPAAAIATGCVDVVLPPREIALKLAAVARLSPDRGDAAAAATGPSVAETDQDFSRIFASLRMHTGNDFSQYKRATVERRVQRRMLLGHFESLSEYARSLEEFPEEVDALFQDLLISVTEFFRDPEAFDILRQTVFEPLLAGGANRPPIRIWVPGCATGEEVYSVAIVLLEALGERADETPLQIFGTDVDALAIDKARRACYPEGISADVAAGRLERFFTRTTEGYRIAKSVRDRCVFVPHNVLKDPPFSRLDLICCRNLLIYLTSPLQSKVLGIFHYALNPDGVLFLGLCETTGGAADLFTIVDKKGKLYRKKSVPVRPRHEFRPTGAVTAPRPAADHAAVPQAGLQRELHRQIENIVLTQFTPPGVVVDENLDIALFLGHSGRYLDPVPGAASLNLMKLARRELVGDLRLVASQAIQTSAPSRRSNVPIEVNGAPATCTIEAVPLALDDGGRFFAVLFRADDKGAAGFDDAESATGDDFIRVRELEGELAATKEYMQGVIERHEVTNEELQSAYEEIQSANEELQSTNEELETAREELQSTNEELATVNEELGTRNLELTRTVDDLKNLLSSVNLPILMLDETLRVRHFTPSAQKLFNLIDGDVGRPITNIHPNVDVPDLKALVDDVLESLATRTVEVRDAQNRWYELRVQPYRTADRKITGCVLVFVDITLLKNAERLRAAAEAVRDADAAITVQDFDGVIEAWNARAAALYGYGEDEAIGANVRMLVPPERREELQQLRQALRRGERAAPLRTTRVAKDGNVLHVTVTPWLLANDAGEPRAVATLERVIDE
jgi:two-component system CheB/CheR fusion protein